MLQKYGSFLLEFLSSYLETIFWTLKLFYYFHLLFWLCSKSSGNHWSLLSFWNRKQINIVPAKHNALELLQTPKNIYLIILDLNLLTAGVYCSSAPTACTSLTNCSLDLIKMAAKKCNQFQNATNVSDKTTTLQFSVFTTKTDILCRKWIFAS